MQRLVTKPLAQVDFKLRREAFESNPHQVAPGEIFARGSTALIRRNYKPFKAFDSDGETYIFYAAKTIRLFRKGKAQRKDQVARINREIQLLKECSNGCEFVVAFLDAFFDGENHIELGTELCELGSLERVSKVMPVRGRALKCVLFCAFSGVSHVHKHGIVHGDIKPGNLLVNRKGIVKLCDFGCAQKVDSYVDDDTAEYGTLRYAAPEILPRFMGKKDFCINLKQDVWALGVLTIDLFYGKNLPDHFQVPSLSSKEVKSTLKQAMNSSGRRDIEWTLAPTDAELWTEVVHAKRLGLEVAVAKGYASIALAGFVRGCLESATDQRPSAVEMLNSKYLCFQKTKGTYREVLSSFAQTIRESEEQGTT